MTIRLAMIAVALVAAIPAHAQSGDGSQFQARFDRADKNKDGVLSRDEAPRRIDFDAADANRDGALTMAEIEAFLLARRGS